MNKQTANLEQQTQTAKPGEVDRFDLASNPPSFEAIAKLPQESRARLNKPLPPIAGVGRLLRFAKLGESFADWYRVALGEACEVASLAGWDIVRFVDVIAVTSPRVSVRRNIRQTYQYLATGRLLDNATRQTRRSLARYEKTGEVGSNKAAKIRAFRAAILGDSEAIVLDTWIAKSLKIRQESLNRRGLRQACEDRIVKTARRFGYSPRDTQAAIWAGYILGQSSRKPLYLPIVEEYANFRAYGCEYPQTGTIDRIA